MYICINTYYIKLSGEMYVQWNTHITNKKILGQIVCYKQEFVISEQFPMSYCSTWLRSLLCYIKKFVIEEFVIRVFHCICNNMYFPGTVLISGS